MKKSTVTGLTIGALALGITAFIIRKKHKEGKPIQNAKPINTNLDDEDIIYTFEGDKEDAERNYIPLKK